MNRILKKALTAGILALMACTSMSAMAEPQNIFVGYPTAGNAVSVSSWAEACQVIADESIPGVTCQDNGYNCLSFTGTVLYTGLDHATCSGKFGSDTVFNYSAGITCNDKLVGNQNNFGLPFGCYEFKELNTPRNNDWCELPYPLPSHIKGLVACNDTRYNYNDLDNITNREYHSCVWVNSIQNDRAREIMAYCTKLHEGLHIQQARSGNYSRYGYPECKDGFLGMKSSDNSNERYGYHNAEYEAFGLDSRCLQGNQGLCGDDQACRDEIERHINHTQETAEHHEQCARFSSNESQEYTDVKCNEI